jgi:hypothetical protein
MQLGRIKWMVAVCTKYAHIKGEILIMIEDVIISSLEAASVKC